MPLSKMQAQMTSKSYGSKTAQAKPKGPKKGTGKR
jgi:hypothetical protein